jgi:hypothetical protein
MPMINILRTEQVRTEKIVWFLSRHNIALTGRGASSRHSVLLPFVQLVFLLHNLCVFLM